MAPRILLVGAYERDNLGDLLFLLVTERYLAGADIVAAAPFRADMSALLDRAIPAYGPLLRDERFDAIWTVGGQVGAIDVARAFRMSAPPRRGRRFARASARRRAAMLRRATGTDAPPLAPYIPDPLAHPANAGALAVVNSAGLSGIRGVEPPERRAELLALLRGHDVVVVRDVPSSRALAAHGIGHALEPDAVHALGVLWPGERDPQSRTAIVQVSRAILRRLGHEQVAAALAAARALRGLRIRVLLAGTATGHDSVADADRLVGALRRAAPGVDADLVPERRPRALVEHIRTARVVVGTSLHVRIAAAAYGVPRVSLARWKPAQYARTWDPRMPYGVTLDRLDDAVAHAVAAAERPEEAERAGALARRADTHLARLAARVMEAAAHDTPADRAVRLARRRALATGAPPGHAQCSRAA